MKTTIRHKKSDKLYTLICESAKRQNSFGRWVPVVVYMNHYNEIFVRDIEDFNEAFERL